MATIKYVCQKCKKVFSHKGHYTAHMERKNPCVKENKNISNKKMEVVQSKESDKNTCEHCGIKFSRSENLKRHLTYCKNATNKNGLVIRAETVTINNSISLDILV